MQIGILETAVGKSGEKGFYNFQAVGLARLFSPVVDKVIVYKAMLNSSTKKKKITEIYDNVTVSFIRAKNIGINGIIDLSELEKSIDVLIYFSDTQILVPRVYKWCKQNDIKFFPYIGVLNSHSTNCLKRKVIDTLFMRNLSIYKKSHCFVKTPDVETKLKKIGVDNTILTPVGLDLDLVKEDYEHYNVVTLKYKFGYDEEDKVILYVARLIDEKQPLKMIRIFNELLKIDNTYKLLIVGTGPLEDVVKSEIHTFHLQDKVTKIEKIPNTDIWQLYRISDCFVNLNEQEIFGMAILESMYYGCKVVAKNAPGPEYIITSGVDGVLCDTDEDIIDGILNQSINRVAMHNKIINEFTWQASVDKMLREIVKENDK